MQSRYSDGNSVCPSVCLAVCLSVRLSNACIVTKRKKAVFRFLANVNSSSGSLYVVVRPSVVCRLSVVCDVRAPYSGD